MAYPVTVTVTSQGFVPKQSGIPSLSVSNFFDPPNEREAATQEEFIDLVR